MVSKNSKDNCQGVYCKDGKFKHVPSVHTVAMNEKLPCVCVYVCVNVGRKNKRKYMLQYKSPWN